MSSNTRGRGVGEITPNVTWGEGGCHKGGGERKGKEKLHQMSHWGRGVKKVQKKCLVLFEWPLGSVDGKERRLQRLMSYLIPF